MYCSVRWRKGSLQLRYPETKIHSGIQWSLCCWEPLTSGSTLWPTASLWKNSSRCSLILHTHTRAEMVNILAAAGDKLVTNRSSVDAGDGL